MTADFTQFKSAIAGPQVSERLQSLARSLAPAGTPTGFPHYTPPGDSSYKYKVEHESFWTSGFFPGSLWALYERAVKHEPVKDHSQLLATARQWSSAIQSQQHNKSTHDIGFMILPSFKRQYELTNDLQALETIRTAADSLMSRYNPKVRCIRSWDRVTNGSAYSYQDPSKYFLVIIDNMMNLELLYYASQITGDGKYAEIADIHAESTLKNHFRENWSTIQLVVYDDATGELLEKRTHEGLNDDSCWSQGHSWAVYGFALAYEYSRNPKYLEAARGAVEYMMTQVPEDGMVYWDFDSARPTELDVSAAVITISGMLLLHKLDPQRDYLTGAHRMLSYIVNDCLVSEGDALLAHSTINNNEHADPKQADLGLVYADYYFMDLGNRLLDLGLL